MVSGSVWAIAGEIIAGGARALAYIVYAKLLSPADFGVVAFSLLLVGIFPLVIDNSIGLALMRHSEDEANIYNTAFVLNIAPAIVIADALSNLNLGRQSRMQTAATVWPNAPPIEDTTSAQYPNPIYAKGNPSAIELALEMIRTRARRLYWNRRLALEMRTEAKAFTTN